MSRLGGALRPLQAVASILARSQLFPIALMRVAQTLTVTRDSRLFGRGGGIPHRGAMC
jgi:hypothetical protein